MACAVEKWRPPPSPPPQQQQQPCEPEQQQQQQQQSRVLQDMMFSYTADGSVEKLKALMTRPGAGFGCARPATGDTPLLMAARRGHLATVRLLLQHGVDATVLSRDGESVLDIGNSHVRKAVLDRQLTPDAQFAQACWQGCLFGVRHHLRHLTDEELRSARNRDGCPAGILLVRDLERIGRLAEQFRIDYRPAEVLRLLQDRGLDVNAAVDVPTGRSPLHFVAAAAGGSGGSGGSWLGAARHARPLLTALAQAGANLEAADSRQYTPLHCACLAKATSAVKELLRLGASHRAIGLMGSTPLHLSAMQGDAESAALLLHAGADPGAADAGGQTPVDLANSARIRCLLEGRPAPPDRPQPDRPRRVGRSRTEVSPASAAAASAESQPLRLPSIFGESGGQQQRAAEAAAAARARGRSASPPMLAAAAVVFHRHPSARSSDSPAPSNFLHHRRLPWQSGGPAAPSRQDSAASSMDSSRGRNSSRTCLEDMEDSAAATPRSLTLSSSVSAPSLMSAALSASATSPAATAASTAGPLNPIAETIDEAAEATSPPSSARRSDASQLPRQSVVLGRRVPIAKAPLRMSTPATVVKRSGGGGGASSVVAMTTRSKTEAQIELSNSVEILEDPQSVGLNDAVTAAPTATSPAASTASAPAASPASAPAASPAASPASAPASAQDADAQPSAPAVSASSKAAAKATKAKPSPSASSAAVGEGQSAVGKSASQPGKQQQQRQPISAPKRLTAAPVRKRGAGGAVNQRKKQQQPQQKQQSSGAKKPSAAKSVALTKNPSVIQSDEAASEEAVAPSLVELSGVEPGPGWLVSATAVDGGGGVQLLAAAAPTGAAGLSRYPVLSSIGSNLSAADDRTLLSEIPEMLDVEPTDADECDEPLQQPPDSVFVSHAGAENGTAGAVGGSDPLNDTISSLSSTASGRDGDDAAYSDGIYWRQGPKIGSGSFGVVRQGLTEAGRIIAVKQVSIEREDSSVETELRRIRQEVEILRNLRHRNIVQLLGTRCDGDMFYIIMEFVPGGSIRGLLDRYGSLSERVCRRYLRQVVSGVAFLHANGVVHRDIKGHNIMVTDAGVIKLIDFGCAKRLHATQMSLSGKRAQQQMSLEGTPYWMAPEVVLEAGHGAKSDCWSVGCTLLEMATTRPPFADMPPMAAIFAIGNGEPKPPTLPQEFSADAHSFYAGCLVRDPALRPAAEDLAKHRFLRARSRAESSGGTGSVSSADHLLHAEHAQDRDGAPTGWPNWLDDFLFAHIKGQKKEIEVEKSEDALGLTITDNGAGYAFIKRIKAGSIIDRIDHIQPGDHIEKIDGENFVGKRHFDVAKRLKEIPRGTTFVLRLVSPEKSPYANLNPRSGSRGHPAGGGGGGGGLGSGKKTIRLKARGLLGISDAELAQSIWEIGQVAGNPHEFALMVDRDLGEFAFPDGLVFDFWGAVSDAKAGRIRPGSGGGGGRAPADSRKAEPEEEGAVEFTEEF
uniref:ANK_REP_REGION domain-containing protein n=1 Tax=Macrostomum lignano TaxID=282301 RepID=A0A1I8FX53_9PLAT